MKNRRRTVLILVGTAAALLALGAGGEEYAQHEIRARAAHVLGPGATVDIDGDLALWDVAEQHIPKLVVSSEDVHFGCVSDAAVRVELDDVRLGGKPTVAKTEATVTMPLASALEARFSCSEDDYPLGLKVTGTQFVSGGVQVTLSGGPTALPSV